MRTMMPMALILSSVAFLPGSRKVEAQPMDAKTREFDLGENSPRPRVACTLDELSRLRAAYAGTGPAHDLVAARVEAAENALKQPVEFPPRGGQHNQWYQCDNCQMGLVTVDDTHHKCPKCGTVYSGPPYDDVIFSRKHYRNWSNARTAAWAYAITEDERFAQYTADVLLGYADRYLEYPYHDAHLGTGGTGGGHILEQTLSEASMCAVQIAPAYDLVYESSVLSASDHAKIRDGLIVPMLESIDRNKRGVSNWQTWHNAAFITAGAVIGDASWVRKAIEQEKNGFMFQMETSVSDEGMWYENSWGYHFYTLRAMTIIAETADRLGFDLWSHPKLKPMYTLPVSYVMADGSLPRFGDDVNTTLARQAGLFETAYLAYEDPVFLSYLPDGPTWQSIMSGRETERRGESGEKSAPEFPGSAVFETAGHAILRTKGEAGLTAALTFSPFGGFHGHFDKLSFVFFGYGKELGVDPGRAKSQAYRLPIHNEWYRATISHNTVLVDGKAQEPGSGVLKHFAANDEYAGVIVSTTEAYPGVTHRRWLCMTPTCLVVYDELESPDRDRRFDWIYHNRGSSVRCDAAIEAVDLSGEEGGLRYLANVRKGEFEGFLHAVFDGDGVSTHLQLVPGPAEVMVGDGPGESVADRVPFVMATQKGRSVHFIAVIEPVGSGEDPTTSVKDLGVTRDGESLNLWVSRNGISTAFRLDQREGLSIRVDGELVAEEPFPPGEFKS
jgi:hypothetical protein